jgi:GNAT superfamily N-acetyltransferase
MGDVLVRHAALADLDTLCELYRDLAGSEMSALPGERAGAERLLAEILTDRSRHLVVGERDGEVLGTADLLMVANLTHQGSPWAIVENVVVAREARRTGVGAAIFAHLVEVARGAGCCKVELLSGKPRAEAHAFYRSVGFEAVAEGFKLYFDR